MKILGIDFTSRPGRGKPLTCVEAELKGTMLEATGLKEWVDFDEFEAALVQPGPWIAGIDFPFGQSRRFVENIGWPESWEAYVEPLKRLERREFRQLLDDYRENRPAGDKEHRRRTDIAAGSISPQKLYGVPVALMFFEGAPRLLDAGVNIPGLKKGDPERSVVEAYPGVLARNLIGRRSYKNDTKSKQTERQRDARRDILASVTGEGIVGNYGIEVKAPLDLIDDPGADCLDALLCAIQAAWAWTHRKDGYGAPEPVDATEGWIADPAATEKYSWINCSTTGRAGSRR